MFSADLVCIVLALMDRYMFSLWKGRKNRGKRRSSGQKRGRGGAPSLHRTQSEYRYQQKPPSTCIAGPQRTSSVNRTPTECSAGDEDLQQPACNGNGQSLIRKGGGGEKEELTNCARGDDGRCKLLRGAVGGKDIVEARYRSVCHSR